MGMDQAMHCRLRYPSNEWMARHLIKCLGVRSYRRSNARLRLWGGKDAGAMLLKPQRTYNRTCPRKKESAASRQGIEGLLKVSFRDLYDIARQDDSIKVDLDLDRFLAVVTSDGQFFSVSPV